MYVLVEHIINDPQAFWSSVAYALSSPPSLMTLHHCLPTPDGTHAVCVWEAERMQDVSGFLEAYVGHLARNLYYPVDAVAGIHLPAGVDVPPAAAAG
jgi:hypothetical protein